MRAPAPQDHLEFLLSAIYDGSTRLDHPAHVADLRKSGLSDATIAQQKITDVPPAIIDPLLGYRTSFRVTRKDAAGVTTTETRHRVTSAYLIPFADPRGGWMPHIRVKVFPTHEDQRGQTVKYLQPTRSGVRLYFPLATLPAVLYTTATLWLVEGEKKSLAVAQLGLPAAGICGIDGWHVAGSRALHPDLDDVGLRGRIVKVVPDADVQTNPAVARSVHRLAEALEARGAEVQTVILPLEVPAG